MAKLSLVLSMFFILLVVSNILHSICDQNQRVRQTLSKLRPLLRNAIKVDGLAKKDYYFGRLSNRSAIESNNYQEGQDYYDYLIRTARELDLPELLLIAEYNLLDNLLTDFNILRILFKAKNKTTKSDRQFLRNKMIDFINGKLIYNPLGRAKQKDPDYKNAKFKSCIEKPFTFIKEIRF